MRERGAADPIVPLPAADTSGRGLQRRAVPGDRGPVLGHGVRAAVPATTTGATPTQAGLLLAPAMLGDRRVDEPGRTRDLGHRPLQALSAAGAGADGDRARRVAVIAAHPSRTAVGFALGVFGLGFGMVGQVLITAVQNSVRAARAWDRDGHHLVLPGLGGAIGAAVFGAVFAAKAGTTAAGSAPSMLGAATRADVIHGVQAVFLAAAPIALLALAIVLALREVPLATGQPPAAGRPAPADRREPSLPLDRAGRLAGDVQHDPADRADLARHA